MKNYVFKSLFWVLFIFLANFSLLNAQSASGIDVNLNIGGCNNNGICEVGQEDIFSCPADCTPVNPGGGGGGGTTIDYFFKDLKVEVSYNSVIIQWKSTVPTMSNLRWGTSTDYKDGVISNINFLLDHRVEITNLNSGTTYYFSINAESNLGKKGSLDNQFFTTLISPDTTPPGNPTNVKAISSIAGITVSWKNPTDKDFDYIRVLRNDDRFYASPMNGRLVYEGTGNYFTDANVVECHKYFYTLFARDKTGNYSSGALVSIIHNPYDLDKCKEPVIVPPPEIVEPLTDIFIINQNSLTYDFYPGDVFSLNGDDPINIKTNYSAKEKDDDMWIEIRNSDGTIISQYFFSRTKDKDGFVQVTIPSFDKGGYYHVTIYKYNNKVAQLVNYGSFEISKTTKSTSTLSFWYIFWLIIIIIFILLILFLLFILLSKILRRFRKNKENEDYIIKEIRGGGEVQ